MALNQIRRRVSQVKSGLLARYAGNSEYRYWRQQVGTAEQLNLQQPGGAISKLNLRPGSSDWRVALQIFEQLQYSLSFVPHRESVLQVYHDMCASDRAPLILDMGANIGLASAYYRHQFPKAIIQAVEPEPGNFALLQGNLGKDSKTQLVYAAVAGVSGRVRIANPDSSQWGFRTETVQNSDVGIASYSVPDLIEMASAEFPCQPFIAKIDIEGFEKDLFAADGLWIDSFFMIVVELHDWMLLHKANSLPVLQALAQRDRDFVIHGENIISISNTHPLLKVVPQA
jgi:FkbM family methyltransferase